MVADDEMMVNNKSSSKFSETCSRLSHFLKQRRSLTSLGVNLADHHFPSNINNININMPSSPIIHHINAYAMSTNTSSTTLLNFFPNNNDDNNNNNDNNVSMASSGGSISENLISLDLFPLTTSSTNQSTHSLPISREVPRSIEESKTSAPKMTIFYGGQVIVFDDLAEEKAEEIMNLASQLGTAGSQYNSQTQTLEDNKVQLMAQPSAIFQHPPTLSDLPIARRVSLQRFMEKRKDRIASASPYQLQRSMHMDHKYDLVRHLAHKQQQQQLELKLF